MDEDPTSRRREDLLTAVRSFAARQNEIGRMFARSRRMHTSDAAAVVEILSAEERGAPLTPARLAGRLGLTTGATSILLNRLEEAGHVQRVRGHADRRAVTLHGTDAIRATAEAFYDPLAELLENSLTEYSVEELALVTTIVNRLGATIGDYVAAVDRPDRGAPTGS